MKPRPIRRLTCACCGTETRGRQWWNQHRGFGLCTVCIPFVSRGMSELWVGQTYGIKGVHYDV